MPREKAERSMASGGEAGATAVGETVRDRATPPDGGLLSVVPASEEDGADRGE